MTIDLHCCSTHLKEEPPHCRAHGTSCVNHYSLISVVFLFLFPLHFSSTSLSRCLLAHYKYSHFGLSCVDGIMGRLRRGRCFYRTEGQGRCRGQLPEKSEVWFRWSIEREEIKGGGQERWNMWRYRKLLGAALLWQANWSSVWQPALSCHSDEEPICCIFSGCVLNSDDVTKDPDHRQTLSYWDPHIPCMGTHSPPPPPPTDNT